MGSSTDLEALFGAINKAKGQMARESQEQPQPSPEEVNRVDGDDEPREYSVEAALQDIKREQEARQQLLRQVDDEKGEEERRKNNDKAREQAEQERIKAAGEEAGRAKTSAIESSNARRRQQAQNRLAAARARKQAEEDAFNAAVAAKVEAQRKAMQASKASSDAEEEQKRADEAKRKADDEAVRARGKASEAQKLADEAKKKALEASDEEANRRTTIENLEATIKDLENQVKSLTAEKAAMAERSSDADADKDIQDDGLEILDVVPATGRTVANYGNYVPVSDSENTYGSAMKPINSFDAAIYLSNEYNRFHRKGAFSYYIVTQDKNKNVLHGECGNTDDMFEYAFLGALLMLQEVVKNGIKQVLIVVKDENTRDVLIQNAMNVRDNFGKTRSEYARFMRKSNGVDFVASFAIAVHDKKDRNAKYFNLVDALAKTLVDE